MPIAKGRGNAFAALQRMKLANRRATVMLARAMAAGVRVFSRNARNYTDRVPLIVEAMLGCPTLDGEGRSTAVGPQRRGSAGGGPGGNLKGGWGNSTLPA